MNETTTDAFWNRYSYDTSISPVTSLVASSLSVVCCCIVVALYIKGRLRHSPAGEVLVISIFYGMLSSINFAVASIVRVFGDGSLNRRYCDVSGNLLQLFYTPSLYCEGAFFLVLLKMMFSADKHHSSSQANYVFSRKVIAGGVVIGLLFSIGFWVALPRDPLWQTKFAPLKTAWCWVGSEDSSGRSPLSFSVIKAISFSVTILSFLVAAICVAYLRVKVTDISQGGGLFLRMRLVYLSIFLFAGLIETLNRFGVDSTLLSPMQSAIEPLIPAVNALLFVSTEWVRNNSAAQNEDDVEGNMSLVNDFRNTMVANATEIEYDEGNDVWIITRADTAEVFETKLQSDALAKAFNIKVHLERNYLAAAMSFLAGYCDCCGFLALDLFTAHITGNFATIGMALASHSGAIFLKVAGLFVFAMFVLVGHATSQRFGRAHAPMLVGAQTALLFLSWFGAVTFGPFPTDVDKESGGAYLTGLAMVAGMALQNTFQRKYLVGLPITTLMTGNTVGLLFEGWNEVEARWKARKAISSGEVEEKKAPSAALRNVKNNLMAIVAFTCGCVAVTAMFVYEGHWAFMLPPMLSLTILLLGWNDLQPM